MSSILVDQQRPRIRVQMRGERGSCGVTANEYSCSYHVTWSPNKLWISNSICNLCQVGTGTSCTTSPPPFRQPCRIPSCLLIISVAFRDVYPGSLIRIFFIPDPGSASKNLTYLSTYFNPKNRKFLSSRKYDPGCSSRIRIPDPDPDFLPIPDFGVRKEPDPGSGSATLLTKAVMCMYLEYVKIILFFQG